MYTSSIKIPDIDGMTQGKNIDDAIQMARDYIGLNIINKQDNNLDVPTSNYVLPTSKDGNIVTLVDVDIDEYRRKNDFKTIKKTLTIPNYLNKLGKENNINFSELLTTTLKKELHV
ncbi:MAG TPA: type II toxin-antitoxin system HicB family antitoxin [Candidatus Companilactobacillus pullicola]|uniref:Type II toxin-antitoxin system HicB family antitoxin n=1 Tax=Candidatus Companilactobacillus pullicola TaxID=2838523 RepID=A0A9D1ZPF0_9LACO|nr:type II toxin-antitoxin system HicB family antitoxin [Candidatus Companilactobacillus pullicola]